MLFNVKIFLFSVFVYFQICSITQAQIPYDVDTLKLNIDYNDSFLLTSKRKWKFLIYTENRINTVRPFGFNDGPFIQVKGYQNFSGIKINHVSKFAFFTLNMNKLSSESNIKNKVPFSFFGSEIIFKTKPFLIRISKNYQFGTGGGHIESLSLGYNAPPYFHFGLKNNKPVNLKIGSLYFDIHSGFLEIGSSNSPYENHYLKPAYSFGSRIKTRYINSLNLSFKPSIFKNSVFGFNRIFMQPLDNAGKNINVFNRYLPVFNGLFKSSIGGTNEDSINRDQLLIFYYKSEHKQSKYSFGFEYGWNDHKWDFRDLLLSFSHSASYLISFKKTFKTDYLIFEYANMRQQLEYSLRNAGDWYIHGITDGFTNRGQILGVGGSNGIGINRTSLSYRQFLRKMNFLYSVGKIQNDHSYLGTKIWNDHFFSVSNISFLKNITWRSQFTYIFSKNYIRSGLVYTNSFQINSSFYILL